MLIPSALIIFAFDSISNAQKNDKEMDEDEFIQFICTRSLPFPSDEDFDRITNELIQKHMLLLTQEDKWKCCDRLIIAASLRGNRDFFDIIVNFVIDRAAGNYRRVPFVIGEVPKAIANMGVRFPDLRNRSIIWLINASKPDYWDFIPLKLKLKYMDKNTRFRRIETLVTASLIELYRFKDQDIVIDHITKVIGKQDDIYRRKMNIHEKFHILPRDKK